MAPQRSLYKRTPYQATNNHWWPAPVAGQFPSLPPDQLPANGARYLRNYLTHLPGKIVPRGPIGGPANNTDVGSLLSTAVSPMWGAVPIGDSVCITYRAASAGPLVDPWRTPINRPTAGASLTSGELKASVINLRTGTAGLNAGLGAQREVYGSRFTVVGKPPTIASYGATYVAGYGSHATLTLTDGSVTQQTIILQVDPTSAGVSVLPVTTCPSVVQDVVGHYNRLFAAAAVKPAGVAADYDASQLFFTRVGGPTAGFPITDWQDPVSGLVNVISVGSPLEDGDFIVALGRASGHLVIFKRRSVWVLYGTSPDDFVLRKIRTANGCVDARSCCTTDAGVYFASQRGFEFFDGSRFHLLSGPVADDWLEFSNRGPAASTINHSYITVTALRNSYMHIAFGTDPTTVSTVDGAERNYLYNIETGAWSELHSSSGQPLLGPNGAFNRAVVTDNHITLWGASRWAKADNLVYGPQPGVAIRDQDTGSSYDVDLLWVTGTPMVGDEWRTGRLNRIAVDYRHKFLDSVNSVNAFPIADVTPYDSAAIDAPNLLDARVSGAVTPTASVWVPTVNFNNPGAAIARTATAGFVSAVTRVVTDGALVAEGAESRCTGITFRQGQPYTFVVVMRGNAGGEQISTILGLGVDLAQSGFVLTTSYAIYSVTWTPSADRTGVTADTTSSAVSAARTWFMGESGVFEGTAQQLGLTNRGITPLGSLALVGGGGSNGKPGKLGLNGFLPGREPIRNRPMQDARGELLHGDVGLILKASTGSLSPSWTAQEWAVYGMGLEYEIGAERRLG